MAAKKITAMDALGAAPASDDQFVIVDVSDTTESPTGTTKKLAASRVARVGVSNTFSSVQNFTNGVSVQDGGANRVILLYGASGGYIQLLDNAGAIQAQIRGYATTGIQMELSAGGITANGVIRPSVDDTNDLGTASQRWDDVYATNATIQTSDASLKTDIVDTDLGWDFVRALRPVRYRWAEQSIMDPETGEETIKAAGTRPHYGLIAQEVKAVMDAQGIADFAGYIYDEDSGRHGLRYNELWAPLIAAVQRGADIIEAQAAQIAALEARVAALERA